MYFLHLAHPKAQEFARQAMEEDPALGMAEPAVKTFLPGVGPQKADPKTGNQFILAAEAIRMQRAGKITREELDAYLDSIK